MEVDLSPVTGVTAAGRAETEDVILRNRSGFESPSLSASVVYVYRGTKGPPEDRTDDEFVATRVCN